MASYTGALRRSQSLELRRTFEANLRVIGQHEGTVAVTGGDSPLATETITLNAI